MALPSSARRHGRSRGHAHARCGVAAFDDHAGFCRTTTCHRTGDEVGARSRVAEVRSSRTGTWDTHTLSTLHHLQWVRCSPPHPSGFDGTALPRLLLDKSDTIRAPCVRAPSSGLLHGKGTRHTNLGCEGQGRLMLPTGRASESGSQDPGLQGLWALGEAHGPAARRADLLLMRSCGTARPEAAAGSGGILIGRLFRPSAVAQPEAPTACNAFAAPFALTRLSVRHSVSAPDLASAAPLRARLALRRGACANAALAGRALANVRTAANGLAGRAGATMRRAGLRAHGGAARHAAVDRYEAPASVCWAV
jgi:hypothetical protein